MARSNKVVNLNKIRAGNTTTRPESSVFVFDYFAPKSAEGETHQRPLVRVINGSLRRTDDGDWLFRAVNLYRVNEEGKGTNDAIRTYRLSRINGIVRSPA